MPSRLRMLGSLALAAALLPMAACGDKKQEQSTTIEMKDMETVDGTASDAMTDLDGVKAEGTSVVETGNALAASNGASPVTTQKEQTDAGDDSSAEVVAEQ